MIPSEVIDIHGGWTSEDGKQKVLIIQSLNKFEGFVGTPDDVKISLGTISDRTLNFKQTWVSGDHKGAVATVYGRLASDNSSIYLQFSGMRANGQKMKGHNAIYRDSIIGTWITMSEGEDIWNFKLVNKLDISGYYHISNLKKNLALKGMRNPQDVNSFTFSVQSNQEALGAKYEIIGEYKCPNIILTLPPGLGSRYLKLVRKVDNIPKNEEYNLPLLDDQSKSGTVPTAMLSSFSSAKKPSREESELRRTVVSSHQSLQSLTQPIREQDDLRATLLPSKPVFEQDTTPTHEKCLCCILLT